MIPATILSVGQTVDLSNGEQRNVVIFQLPNGTIHEAIVPNETVQQLLSFLAERGKLQVAATVPAPAHRIEAAASVDIPLRDEVHVFGGEVAPTPEVTASPPPPKQRRPKLIGRDDMGNPILDGPIPSPYEPPALVDEDGVAPA